MPTKTDAAPQAPAGLEHKAAPASSELLEADDATGVVEAIVSVTGLLDEDRDVIKPGAYAKTLAKRKPKGIFVHDWGRWVARTESIEELMPGDPRLPKTTKDGKPWPAEAGGLYVKARFNLDTREGKDAYSNVKFFSETGEQEWSIGYKVPPGRSTRTKSGERHIDEVDLYEYSPVLFGAAPLSGTLSVKSSPANEDAPAPEEPDGPNEDERAEPGKDPEKEPEPEEKSAPEPEFAAEEDVEEDDLIALAELAEQAVLADTESKDALFDLHPPSLAQRLELFREFRSMQVPDISDAAARDRAHAALFRLDQALTRGEISLAEAQLEIVLSALRDTGRDPMIRSFTEGALRILSAGGRDVEKWRGPGANEHQPARTPSKSAACPACGTEEKGSRASLDRSPRKNWVESTGDLPGYVREVARSIHEKRGVPLERAIPIAIGTIKRWCAGDGDVNADTKAKACAAVAEWESLKARNRARMAARDASKALEEDLESTRFPHLPGTYEELREEIREQAFKKLSALSEELAHVEVMGTWPDRAVVNAYLADGGTKSYEIGYMLSPGGEQAEMELDEPTPVELKVSLEGGEEEAGEALLPYPSMIDDVTLDLKALLGCIEAKAGRVLSSVNEKRLLAAVESLVAVLKAAGLEVDGTARAQQEKGEEEQRADAIAHIDSTAPSAQPTKALLDPALLARGYRLLAEED